MYLSVRAFDVEPTLTEILAGWVREVGELGGSGHLCEPAALLGPLDTLLV